MRLDRAHVVAASQRLGLGPVVHRAVLTVRRAQRSRRERIWRRELGRRVGSGVAFDRLHGEVSTQAIPVIVCLWNRPSRITDVLELMDAQQSPRPIRLILWNNQPADDEFYREKIAATRLSGAVSSVEYRSSRTNLGGIARFVAARNVWAEGYRGPFIMLDDDQDVSPSFVADLLAAYRPGSYLGWWVYLNHGSYWDRSEVAAGEPASYVGTGGSICDIALVEDTAFFTSLPARFGFLEDIWASAWAQRRGWRLSKVDTPISFVLSEFDQAHALADVKREFYRFLVNDARSPLP